MNTSNFSFSTNCESQVVAHFSRGETILTINSGTGRIGILAEGEAHISTVSPDGTESIMELLSPGDSFGEYLMMPAISESYIVQADTDCTVAFINFRNVVENCNNHCVNHAGLVRTLLLLTSRRAQDLSLHAHLLSRRTIREKLVTYLQYQANITGTREFQIPMTLSRLADYLCVDRTAMTRELKKMNEESLLLSSGRNFTLLNI